MTVAQDPVVEANREMLLQRSNHGIAKYGTMLNRTDLGLRDWLQHAIEETLDQANYLQAAIRFIDSLPPGFLDAANIKGETVTQTSAPEPAVKTFDGSTILFIDDYQRAAMRTAPPGESQTGGLVHASLGFASEAGEFVSEVKRNAIYGKEISPEMKAHMIEELGDACWYIALALAHLDTKMSDALQQNIDKLRKRFPDKFSGAAAEARADKAGVDHRNS